MDIADLCPGCAHVLAARLFCGFHQSAVRDEILDPWESAYVVYLIEDDQAEDSAYAGNRTEAEIRVRVHQLIQDSTGGRTFFRVTTPEDAAETVGDCTGSCNFLTLAKTRF